MNPIALDLFCGAGGASAGFCRVVDRVGLWLENVLIEFRAGAP